MSSRKCSIANCERQHLARGLCRLHYGEWREGEAKRNGTVAICSHDGCKSIVNATGLCRLHYMRKIRGAALDAPYKPRAPRGSYQRKIKPKPPVKRCEYTNCRAPLLEGFDPTGLCPKHARIRRLAAEKEVVPDESRTKTLSPEVQRIVYRQWADAHSGRSGLTVADIAAQWGISAALVNRVVLAVQTCFVIRPMEVRA